MITQFINEFTVSALLTGIATIVTSDKDKCEPNVESISTKNEIVEDDDDEEDDDEPLFPESDDDEPEEDTGYNYNPDDKMYKHLMEMVNIMNTLDDVFEEALYNNQIEQTLSDRFDEYYAVIIPYIELINVSYYKIFPSELKSNLSKLTKVVDKFITDIIDDIYDNEDDEPVDLGVQIKYEMGEITKLANIRIEQGNGRPSFDSIMNIDDTLDETQTKD